MTKYYFISGADTGIGFALAKHLIAQKHTVFASAPTQEGLKKLEGLSPNLYPILLDLREKTHIEELAQTIAKHTPHLDGLINNAGIALGGPVELLSPHDIHNIFAINVFGHIQTTQQLLPLLRKAKQPRLVFTGSAAGYFVRPLLGSYAASKFALEAFVDALRIELKPQKIPVSLIEPGRIKTPIWSVPQDDSLEKHPLSLPYRDAIGKLQQEVHVNAKESPSVAIVIKAMHHALFARQPKIRYRVGIDAHLAFYLNWLPRRFLDWLLVKLFL